MSNRDRLNSYLERVEARLRLGVASRGALLVTFVALTATVVLVFITNAFAFSPASLAAARIALFVMLAGAVGLGVLGPLRSLNRHRAARRAEAAFPQFQQRLITFADRGTRDREPFVELLAADTLELSRHAEPARLAPNRRLLACFGGGAACLGVLIWMIAAGPGFFGYGAARLWTGARRNAIAFYDIHVTPGNAAVRRNSSQTVTAELVGFSSPRARLVARDQSASRWERAEMQPQPGGAGFQFVFPALPESVEYYVEAGRVRSHRFKLRVIDLPSVRQIRVTYHYPAWTGMRDAVEEHGGDLRAVEGTTAELSVITDRPLAGGKLVLNGGREIALSSAGGNSYRGTVRIDRDGAYHIAALATGQLARVSDDFLIEALKPKPPQVTITRPGGDYQASPIEEVTVAMNATDDYGLHGAHLHYSINGGPDRSIDMLGRPGAKKIEGSTVLALENFKLVPGDVVSFYATAKDGHAESHSDMYFIQAEPFDREYSQSQLAGGGGMSGDQQSEISRREKEIIAATWNEQGNHAATVQQAASAGKFLSSAQQKLRGEALSLAGRLDARDLTMENDEFSAFQRDMSAAAEAMGPAANSLGQRNWAAAIPKEEKALQQLLRAEATFRRIQVAFGNQGGGGGAGAGRDLANLFNLELDTEKNQYETGQTAESATQRAQQLDKTLQKLDELARREQQMASQRSAAAPSFEQRWQEEMLHRQAEQLQNELQQLARDNAASSSAQQPGSSSGQSSQTGSGASQTGDRLQRAVDQLRQANADLRRASSPNGSAADARRAAASLAQARQILSGIERQRGSGQLDSLGREAERLASEEHRQATEIRQMFGQQGQDGAGQTRPGEMRPWQMRFDGGTPQQSKLADDRQLLAADLSRLEDAIRDSARQLGASDAAAASKLRQTLGQIDRSDLQNRLDRSAESIRMGLDPGANTVEPQISAGMDRVAEGIRQAQQALKAQPPNPAEEALARVEQLRRDIEGLTRGASKQAGNNGQPGSQGGQQAGNGSQGAPGRAGRSEQANSNSGFTPGGPGGPRVAAGGRNPAFGAYIERPGAANDSSSGAPEPDERTLREAIRQLDGLRRVLRSSPESAADLDQLTRQLEGMAPGKFGTKPGLVEQLGMQALANVDRIELQLRRSLDGQQPDQVRSGDYLNVPPGYQESVADYFRRLSKNR